MDTPRTHYARSGSISVAYQVLGDGPQTIVYAPGWISHVEIMWEDPPWCAFMARLAAFARVILFDKRGTGASDRDVGYPTLDDRMDDIRAVMDAVGVERAAIFGSSEGGNMATLFAASHPERVSHLVLFGCFARRTPTPDYPWAPPVEERLRWIEELRDNWGKAADVSHIAPSRAHDAGFIEWFARLERFSASPSAGALLARLNTEIDVREVLPAIRVPTMVMHRHGDRDANVEEGRYIASRIPGAVFVELEGNDHIFWTERTAEIADHLEEFLTGARLAAPIETTLATILCTDIADSTARRAAIGDAAFDRIMIEHDAAARAVLRRFQGVEINTTGDGILAGFSSPGRAVHAAYAIKEAAAARGLEVRAGIHTGECNKTNGALSGIALNIAARIAALGEPGAVLASRTVADLAIGAGFQFVDRGEHALKGAPGAWRIFAVTR